ncbi:MAG: DUF4388 domain-containing protein [Myxococcaceae bacterium]
MRGLIGDLGTMPLRDLVAYLGNRQATGILQYERADEKRQVVVREGAVVNASSNQPRDYLAQFLINMGQMSEDQYMAAYRAQQDTRVFLGQAVVTMGLATQEAVRNALQLKFREALLSAFAWEEGTFTFTPGGGAAPLPGLEVGVSLLEIYREADVRETAWKAIRAVFPSGQARLVLHRENLAQAPEPGSLDERLTGMIEEGATIDDLVLGLHSTDFFLYQRLYALHRLDAVSVAPSESPTVPTQVPNVLGSEEGAEEIFRAAQAFLQAGNVADAAALARRAYELSPAASTANFLREAEATLTEQLRAELSGDRVPSLRVDSEVLRRLPLSAPERYLLSRVDGQRTVEAIIQVSPIHELEALRCFRGFLDQGLVELLRH